MCHSSPPQDCGRGWEPGWALDCSARWPSCRPFSWPTCKSIPRPGWFWRSGWDFGWLHGSRAPASGAAMDGLELSSTRPGGHGLVLLGVCWRLAQAAPRGCPPITAGRLAQRPLNRAGHCAGRSPEPLRISSFDDASGRAWRNAVFGSRRWRRRLHAMRTLASHASFFTGRWPHELNVQWETPLPNHPFPDAGRIPGVSRLCDRRAQVANAAYRVRPIPVWIVASHISRIMNSRKLGVFFGRQRSSSELGKPRLLDSLDLSWHERGFDPCHERTPVDLVGFTGS